MANHGHGLEKVVDDKNFVIAGGDGHMGTFWKGMMELLQPDASTASVDIGRMSAAKEQERHAVTRDAIDSNFRVIAREGRNRILVLALPYEVFQDENQYETEREKYGEGFDPLKNLLGLKARGARNDCIASLTSLMKMPLDLMENFPGSVVGVHHMHKPPFPKGSDLRSGLDYDPERSFEEQRDELVQRLRTKMRNNVVILTATEAKQSHDRHPLYLKWWKNFLKDMGYEKIVTDLSPEEHDRLMSQVQFLTHSAYLTAAHIIEDTPDEEIDVNKTPVTFALREMVKRMLTLSSDTYKGIAMTNEFNEEVFRVWSEEVKTLRGDSTEDVLAKLLYVTQQVAKDYLEEMRVSRKAKQWVSTPVSRVRDNMLKVYGVDVGNRALTAGSMGMEDAMESYRNTINNPQTHYKQLFDRLRQKYPDYKSNVSNEIIADIEQRS